MINEENLDISIEKAIQKHVNGHISRVSEDVKTIGSLAYNTQVALNKHISDNNVFIEKMEPLVDALNFINAFRKFLIWIAAPISIIVGFLMFLKQLIR